MVSQSALLDEVIFKSIDTFLTITMKQNNLLISVTLAVLFTSIASCSLPPTNEKAKTPPEKKISQANIDLAVASLDSLAKDLMKRVSVPGMSVAVVHNDRIIYSRGFGVREVGTDLKVDPDTVFQLASLAKPLSATVVAGVVGEGQVKWDDPVKKYLPHFTLSDPKIGEQVTIADMFSHRSGLPGSAGNVLVGFDCKREEIIDRIKYLPLNPYRTTYSYSNMGLTIGAEAVAKAKKLPWEDLSKKILYGPMGMNSTSFLGSDYDKHSNKAIPHVLDFKNNRWVASQRQGDAQGPAGGGASSSANDLAKWMILVLNEGTYQGKSVIDKKALLQTQQPQIKNTPLLERPNWDNYYGLAMNIGRDELGFTHVEHSGDLISGVSTQFDLLPSEHLGIVVLTNTEPIGVAWALTQDFYDIVETGQVQRNYLSQFIENIDKKFNGDKKELTAKSKPTNPTRAPKMRELVDTYTNDYLGKATIKVSGNKLLLKLKPCGTEVEFRLHHWDGNKFYYSMDEQETAPSFVEFSPSKDGHVASIQIDALNESGFGKFYKNRNPF